MDKKIVRLIDRVGASRLAIIFSTLIYVGVFFKFIFTALEKALIFNGYAANGAFQLLNPLRRLQEGQTIGVDFNFFHGIGVPYIHYPLFLLFGGDFFASELARWVLSPLLFVGSTLLFFYLFTKSLRITYVLSSIALGIGMMAYPFLVMPFNSMLGVRSVTLVLIACLFLKRDYLRKRIVITKTPFINLFTVLSGVLLTVGFLLGTEFGIAGVIAYTVTILISENAGLKSKLFSLVTVGISALVVLVPTLIIATAGHPFGPLRYALIDLPMDQFWYFGAPPNRFLHIGNIFSQVLGDKLIWPLYILFGLAVVLTIIYKKRFGKDAIFSAYLFALIAGFISQVSMLGYYHSSQAYSLARLSTLVVISAAALLYPLFKQISVRVKYQKGIASYQADTKTISAYAVVFFVIFSFSVFTFHVIDTKNKRDVVGSTRRLKERMFNHGQEYLSDGWKDTLSAVMPTIQAENSVPILDLNTDGFKQGINSDKGVIATSSDVKNLEKGSVVYLKNSGRQIVSDILQKGGYAEVKIANTKILDAAKDGFPNSIIIEKDAERNDNLWSLYSGLLEYQKGSFNPSTSGSDYIIHALGNDAREKYLQDFEAKKPEYVSTLQKSYFLYEEWLQDNHWDFYEKILANYKVAKQSDTYVIWKRDSSKQWASALQNIGWKAANRDGASIDLQNEEIGKERRVVLLRVQYDINGKNGPAVYDKTTRWLLEPSDGLITKTPISLSPYRNEVIFPVVIPSSEDGESSDEEGMKIDIKSYNILPIKSNVNVTSVDVAYPQFDKDTLEVLTKTFTYNGHDF